MIEEILLDYMETILNVPCYMTRPETAPASYVLIEKTGGEESNHLKASTFAFQAYAPTLFGAAELNEAVKEAAKSIEVLPEIASSKYSTDYNFTNPADKHSRYQAIFKIYHY